MDTVLLVGTRKGMWIGTSDEARKDWDFTGPHFDMEEVYSCLVDTRGGTTRLLVGASSSARSGSTRSARSGTPATAARPSTPCWPTRATRTR